RGGREPDAGEGERPGAERAHAVEAELRVTLAADFRQRDDVIQNAGRGLAGDVPDPLRVDFVDEALDRVHVERLAPAEAERREVEPRARRLIDEPIAELAVRDHDAMPAVQRKLRTDRIVRERAA